MLFSGRASDKLPFLRQIITLQTGLRKDFWSNLVGHTQEDMWTGGNFMKIPARDGGDERGEPQVKTTKFII